MEPRIQYAKTEDGVSIAFWTLGEGMPLVHAPLVPHGHMQLEWQMEEVRRWYESLARERMLVGYDRRGTGLSDRDVVDYSLDAQVLDLEAIVKRLGITQFALFAGLNLGPAAIAYATRHPDKVTHLLLWCTSPRAPKILSDARYNLLDPLMENDWRTYTETRAHWAVGWDNPQEARKYAALLREGSTPESFRAYQRALSEFDASALLKEVRSPTLVLHMRSGARSLLAAARQLASQIPDARLTAVEGSLPYPWVGRQESALTAVDEFLGEAKPAAAAAQPPYSSVATARLAAAVADIPSERRPAELADPHIQYAKTADGVTIAYYAIGQGPPVVSMALPSHLQAERKLPGERRTGEDVSRIATFVRYDHRGFGLSERDCSTFPLDALVSDLEAVVDKLGLATFVLFARGGFTGPVAISYAAAHPERVSQLVLMLGFARIPPPFHQQVQALLLSTNDWRFGSESLTRLTLGWEDEEYSREFAALYREASTFDAFRAFWRDAGQWDVRDLLPNVVMPTLVINATQSRIAGPEQSREMASLMPDARVAIADGTTALERLAQIQAAIASFLPVPDAVWPEVGPAATVRLPSDSVRSFAAGRYTVKRLLGEGGQKTVYLVHDAALERDCALALLKMDVLDADSLARVRREGQAMARLTHPNIVTVHDIGDEDGRPYLVCEYVPGGDLRHELDRANGPLPLKRALAIAEDLCSALAFAHSQGIIHRDVKPSNVHVARDGSAKLGDFGLALAADQSRLTMAGTAMGTAAYMAPEQARGQPVDARSDLYSLGCLLYELITGRPLFSGDDPMAVVAQHVHAVPEPPSQHNAQIPRDLEQLVLGLLAKAREERPSSAEDVLVELQRIAAAT